MNKKIFGGIAVLAIAAVAAWNINLNSQKSDLSDVSLANVEALACEIDGWVGSGWYVTFWYMCSWSCTPGSMFRCPV